MIVNCYLGNFLCQNEYNFFSFLSLYKHTRFLTDSLRKSCLLLFWRKICNKFFDNVSLIYDLNDGELILMIELISQYTRGKILSRISFFKCLWFSTFEKILCT